jgi:prophage regulatory protein
MAKPIEVDPALGLAKVVELTGLSRQTIWRMVRDGRFPKAVYLTERKPAWRASVVQRWLDKLPSDRPAA